MEGNGNHHHQQALNILTGNGQGGEGVGRDEEYNIGASNEFHDDTDDGSLEPVSSNEPALSIKRISRVLNERLGIWDRIRGKGRRKVGWVHSLKSIATYSWLNFMFVFLPIAWAVHFSHGATGVSHTVIFGFCFLALVPLSKLLDYGGEQLALYCGQDLGDLIVVTLNNAVEAALALFLLAKCELKLLQSTIIGVVLLRLLLIPGTSFIVGGARVAAQELHPHLTQLNHTLLTTGALTLLLPAAYFAALDRTAGSPEGNAAGGAVNDTVRGQFLKISRGLSIILLAVYVCSRFFLHDPPGEEDELHQHEDAPAEFKEKVEHMAKEEPDVNPWACIIVLILAVILMAVTAEFLVESIEPMREKLGMQEEWFGLILLPIVSFSADGILSSVYFIRYTLKNYLGTPFVPSTLAEARAIDLSIQFTIFWMPLLVLVGWFTHKPMSLLFDFFEVAILLGACFLVNYVTADAKTNWAEGAMMVAFYIMIALTAWFYPGQQDLHAMLSCTGVQEAAAAHHALLAEHGGADGHPGVATPVKSTNHAAKVNMDNEADETAANEPSIEDLSASLQNLLDLYDVL